MFQKSCVIRANLQKQNYFFSNKLANKSLIGHTGHSGQNHFLSHHITKNIDLIDLITVHIKAKITFD